MVHWFILGRESCLVLVDVWTFVFIQRFRGLSTVYHTGDLVFCLLSSMPEGLYSATYFSGLTEMSKILVASVFTPKTAERNVDQTSELHTHRVSLSHSHSHMSAALSPQGATAMDTQ